MADLVALRQLLQRLLAAVGSLVALSTLTTAAALEMRQSVSATGPSAVAQIPKEFVLVLGAAHSLFIAAFYVPAATALQRRGQRLRDELVPLGLANQASAIVSAVEDRDKLERFLGLQQGAVADLQEV
jgi:hypothetical protein